eukprot:6015641-Amphidinium_carterae.1
MSAKTAQSTPAELLHASQHAVHAVLYPPRTPWKFESMSRKSLGTGALFDHKAPHFTTTLTLKTAPTKSFNHDTLILLASTSVTTAGKSED